MFPTWFLCVGFPLEGNDNEICFCIILFCFRLVLGVIYIVMRHKSEGLCAI